MKLRALPVMVKPFFVSANDFSKDNCFSDGSGIGILT
jgi:hypothetical protein